MNKTPIKRTTKRKTSMARNTRQTSVRAKSHNSQLAKYLVPAVFIFGLSICLFYMLFLGYRTVTASTFFDLEEAKIDIRGTNRVPKDKVVEIVKSKATKGVWNADISEIKQEIEKFAFVKNAVVSRVLPDGLRVRVDEREAFAVVRRDSIDYWVDKDAVILSQIGRTETRPPYFLRNWDSSQNERNKKRLEIYANALKEWQDLSIANRIGSISLEDENDLVAMIDEIPVRLGNKDFGKRLNLALSAISDKKQQIESLISSGGNPIVRYKNS
jgi:cell division septal protein FtsQ